MKSQPASSMLCRAEGEEDEAAADAAMLSQEEALIVTNRLHQVSVFPWTGAVR